MASEPHVTATLVDENTLDVGGVLFHRRDDDEVLLQPLDIAATLDSDGEYERKMDSLLCHLTGGLFSKTKTYSLDFMVSCVEEAFEARNARQTSTTHAIIVSDESTDCATGRCKCELCGKAIDPLDHYCKHCGAEVDR